MNEATARTRINDMLRSAGWRFFADEFGPANVQLEVGVRLTQSQLDGLGEEYENRGGRADYLLLDDHGKPLVVLEAKGTGVALLTAKEQARDYAAAHGCRFVFLSNGLQHYYWDLQRGEPRTITVFPTLESLVDREEHPSGDPQRLVDEPVGSDYIVLSKDPDYAKSVWWRNDEERDAYITEHKLPFMRDYQVSAVHAIQAKVADGEDRFLIEMATGTGKTLTAAAIIRLFMNTGNSRRVLFLVDRLELEDQALKALHDYLGRDRRVAVYKEHRDTWRHADILITTVQSLLIGNRYRHVFSPTDFDFVISDEAHRSISGMSRAVFEYFVGYKLGLTATPKDYLRGLNEPDGPTSDPLELERRQLRDTYRTFGCPSGVSTFRYGLIEGANDGHLVNPTTIDARTNITAQLLSEDGLHASFTDDEGEVKEGDFSISDFERDFFSESTNRVFCETFLREGLRDPISNEFGKSIVYCVSQRHAQGIVSLLNELAGAMWGGRYQSDFAVQVTSSVKDAQLFARQFANNGLRGSANFISEYRTSKTRVCVTVGMMTTGYDCPDMLNLGLFRPIFSPTEFVQIKGRGTRPHDFTRDAVSDWIKESYPTAKKTTFKLFDFFGNFEYFDKHHDYNEKLALPDFEIVETIEQTKERLKQYVWRGDDRLSETREGQVGPEGMTVDRMLFDRFKDGIANDPEVTEAADEDDWERVVDHVQAAHFEKPEDYFNLPKLRRALGLDDDVPLREILEFALDRIPEVKTRDQRAEEAFDAFVADNAAIEPAAVPAVRSFFLAYATNDSVRDAIDSGNLQSLTTNPAFNMEQLGQVPELLRTTIPKWIDLNFTRKG